MSATQSPDASPAVPLPGQGVGTTAPPHDTYIRTHSRSPPLIQVLPDIGPNSLPIAGTKSAPPKFTGDYTKITEFIRHYEKICARMLVTRDTDKIRNIGQYCSKRVRNFLEGLESYELGNWEEFKKDFLHLYDAERDEKRYKEKDLIRYVQTTRNREAFTTLSSWKQYDRGFIRIAGWLRSKGKITKEKQDFYYWKGIPRAFRA